MTTYSIICANQIKMFVAMTVIYNMLILFLGKFEILQIKPRETLPVPLPFICATLYMRPSDWPVKFCDQPIQWQHVGLPGDDHIKEKILKCEMPDDSGNYRY